MEMPHIQTCDVDECAYNRHNECHALAITVEGTEGEPLCDTFWSKQENMKGGDPTQMGSSPRCGRRERKSGRPSLHRAQIPCVQFSGRTRGISV